MGSVVVVPAGTVGFDCNFALDMVSAKAFAAAGYQFVARYLPRIAQASNDLTSTEVNALHLNGIAVLGVQHVESAESWTPSVSKGTLYGLRAAQAARECGLGAGASVACDLEGVAVGTAAADVIAYCTQWFTAVKAGGYKPILYVGWHCGLTPAQLYALPFTGYWAAYNLNGDQYPAVRGVQMRQHTAGGYPRVAGQPDLSRYDVNVVQTDAKGDRPSVFAPDEWAGALG